MTLLNMRGTLVDLNFSSRRPVLRAASPRFAVKTVLSLASASVLLSACGGGGGGSATSNPPGGGSGNQPSVPTSLLEVGLQSQYSGTTVYSYANIPTAPGLEGSTTTSFTEQVKMLAAPAGSDASYDVQTITNYNTTASSDPSYAPLAGTTTLDTYKNLVTQGSTQHVETVGSKSTDIESTQAIITTISYPTPIPGESYPLQTGASLSLPVAQVFNSVSETVKSASDLTPTGAYIDTTQYTRKADSSKSGTEVVTQTGQPNYTNSITINADSSGTFTDGTNSAAVGVPVNTGVNAVIYTIPVTVSFGAPGTAVTTNNYNAPDWYPGNNVPSSPLVTASKTVVGAVTTLPTGCKGALVLPNMFEIDTKETDLEPLKTEQIASYTVTTAQAFVSNGVVVCSLKQQVETDYSLSNGFSIWRAEADTTRVLTGLSFNP